MRIRFIQGLKVQQSDGNGPEYTAGETYDFDGFVAETYAKKYIRRGYAVEEPAAVAPPTPAAVAPEAADPPSTPPAATEQANVAAPRPERRRRSRAS